MVKHLGSFAVGVLLLVLAGCAGSPKELNGGPQPGTLTYEGNPAHIGQALAVNAAKEELGITPQAANDMWVTSTLIVDPHLRPAFWANLIVQGHKPTNFWDAVATVVVEYVSRTVFASPFADTLLA